MAFSCLRSKRKIWSPTMRRTFGPLFLLQWWEDFCIMVNDDVSFTWGSVQQLCRCFQAQVSVFTIYFRSREITFEKWPTLKPKLFDCRGVDHHTSIVWTDDIVKKYEVIRWDSKYYMFARDTLKTGRHRHVLSICLKCD